jgi:PEGA domain
MRAKLVLVPKGLFVALCGVLGAVGDVAQADPPSPSHTEAAERFDRALRLVDDGDLSGGLAEFQRAYALAPLPVILYNVGLIYAELGRPVEAARALREVLSRPQAVAPQHAVRAREVLAKALDRIGEVTVSANVPEGTVELDNIEVGKWPLGAPLDVSSGAHVVGVLRRGFAPARKEVHVAAHERVGVTCELVPIEGLLAHIAVRSHLPQAGVLVDGLRIGETPLETTITVVPGVHHVELRRPGYTSPSRDLSLQDGAVAEVTLEPAVDPEALSQQGGWLAVRASESQAVARLDGQDLGLVLDPVRVPAGLHRLRVERAGFLDADRDVDVPLGGVARVAIVFEPTSDTRVRYVSSASARRTWSFVTIGLGAALAAGGAALALVEQNQLGAAQDQLRASEFATKPGQPCSPMTTSDLQVCQAAIDDAQTKVNDLETRRTVGWVAAATGGAVLVAGAVLLFTGEDPHRYDRPPIQPLLEGWKIAPAIGPRAVSITAATRF